MEESLKRQIRKKLMRRRADCERKLKEAKKTFKETVIPERRNDPSIPDCSSMARGNGGRITSLIRCIKQTDRALNRLEQGTYGVCEKCGTKISLARLANNPEAKCCTPCEAKLENSPRTYFRKQYPSKRGISISST